MKKSKAAIKYDPKVGDVFNGSSQPSSVAEHDNLKGIIEEQVEQHKGNPEEYGYPALRWHHYWGIVNGEYTILTRTPDSMHPANGRWAMWAEGMRPLGVEPPGRTDMGDD